MNTQEFSKYERARIIGARGLQISMDAPLLITIEDNALDQLNYDPLKIAEKELDEGVLPISVNKPMPIRREENIEKLKVEESKMTDEAKEAAELEEEKEIAEGGEMLELTNNSGEDEDTDETSDDDNPRAEIE